MPLCSICAHPQRVKLDEALIRERATLRNTAARFAVGFSSVKRHKDKCLARDIAAGIAQVQSGKSLRNKSPAVKAAAKQMISQQDLFEKVQELADAAFEILQAAQADGDRQNALKALKEARDTLALLGKALGYLRDGTTIIHDSRRQLVQVFDGMTPDQIRALVGINSDEDDDFSDAISTNGRSVILNPPPAETQLFGNQSNRQIEGEITEIFTELRSSPEGES